MALHRASTSTRSSHQNEEEEMENNGYIQIFVKPLEQGDYSVILSWLGLGNVRLSRQQVGLVAAGAGLLLSAAVYQILVADIGSLFYRLAALIMPVFAIASAFFWLALYLRDSWSPTSVYILFIACFFGEFIGQCLVETAAGGSSPGAGGESPGAEAFVARPLLALIVLLSVSAASAFSSLDTSNSSAVIVFVSVIRFLSATTQVDLPQSTRPFVAYLAGLTGVIGAKYMETLFKPPVTNYVTNEGKIPVIKRRRSSSSAMHGFSNAQRAGRRTSLPALIHSKSQNSTVSYEGAIISEAHGLITDMLADSNLPPHVVGGLRTVSNLLKPPDTHVPMHKPKVSPLVSLTETANYGSDTEDLPYTGERPTSLPKRLRRSLPPSLIRRMSTSTWTTTTSATGMPTLEPEPCRTRSSSFRHSRDNTPGSSPVNSRSNSPSPSSPTTISLTIPKSRSFSLVSPGLASPGAMGLKRGLPRDRRSLQHPMGSSGGSCSDLLSPVKAEPTLQVAASPDEATSRNTPPLPASPRSAKSTTSTSSVTSSFTPATSTSAAVATAPSLLSRRLNITSDYESSDSPGNSDHSDNITAGDESTTTSGAGPISPVTRRKGSPALASGLVVSSQPAASCGAINESSEQGSSTETSDSTSLGSDNTVDSVSPVSVTDQQQQLQQQQSQQQQQQQQQSQQPCKRPTFTLITQDSVGTRTEPSDNVDSSNLISDEALTLPYDIDLVENNPLLNVSILNQWDYPIFDMADQYQDTILSQVSYKIFLETGLFETFRIPLPEFLNYFHALELGYREKPYHNRVHATDVLHGVYYLTTQPIPGFDQVNPDVSDLLSKHQTSSSESDSEMSEKAPCTYRPGFTAEDTYGIMGGNFPALELMALYTAAAMHDYDHPGRTNAFLVATHSKLAVLYNDRSVLESHHAASAWELLLANPRYNWLCQLEKGEFKRFRFLVIEAVLATDLKQHFQMVAEFNAKASDDDAPGIDWSNETDRLLCANMVIKLADINGPTKRKDLHVAWTDRITEEFYEQGDEEARMGMPISPYMDRENPQLAKLQESFINHLVAPLCNAVGAAGLLPGTWVEDESAEEGDEDSDKGDSSAYKDTEDEETESERVGSPNGAKKNRKKRIQCALTQNLEDNHAMWVVVIKRETAAKEREAANTGGGPGGGGGGPPRSPKDTENHSHLEPIQLPQRSMSVGDKEMESIKEEDTPPNSANSLKEEDQRRASVPVLRPPTTAPLSVTFAQPAVTPPHHESRSPGGSTTGQPLVSCLAPALKKQDASRSQGRQAKREQLAFKEPFTSAEKSEDVETAQRFGSLQQPFANTEQKEVNREQLARRELLASSREQVRSGSQSQTLLHQSESDIEQSQDAASQSVSTSSQHTEVSKVPTTSRSSGSCGSSSSAGEAQRQ